MGIRRLVFAGSILGLLENVRLHTSLREGSLAACESKKHTEEPTAIRERTMDPRGRTSKVDRRNQTATTRKGSSTATDAN